MSARPPFVHSSTSYASHHGFQHHSDHSSSTSASSNAPTPPYRDYPPEKAEVEYLEHANLHPHSHVPTTHTHNHHHHHPPARQLPDPHRAIYGARRPSWTTEGAAAGQKGKGDAAGGRLGKALIVGWVVTTLMFVAATAFYKGELFSALDRLSIELREMGYTGQAIFGLLIFVTTIPPLPLYSTLMVLSGYTFGAWEGFVISYVASLLGAVVVFLVARTFLRDCITKCLSSSATSMSLLNIIPAKPHLLLLIRIAPYPYNLLNVILASSPTLSLRTYTACTAVSLLKVILHTWFGSGVHDISDLHRPSSGLPPPPPPPFPPHHGHAGHHVPFPPVSHGPPHSDHDDIKAYWTWGGLALCVVLFVYLHHVAKKALARAQAEVERDARIEEGHGTEELVEVGR